MLNCSDILPTSTFNFPSLYLITFSGTRVQENSHSLFIGFLFSSVHSAIWTDLLLFKCLAIWFPRALCVSASHIYFQAPFCLHLTFPLLWILLTSVQLLRFLIHNVHLCMRKFLWAWKPGENCCVHRWQVLLPSVQCREGICHW